MAEAASNIIFDESKDYLLALDSFGVQNVILMPRGIEKICEGFYREKYSDIRIDPCAYNRYDQKDLRDKINSEFDSLGEGEIKGGVFVSYKDSPFDKKKYYGHASPFIFVKVGGEKRLFYFEDNLKSAFSGLEFPIFKVEGYDGLQNDSVSCSVFSLDLVKKCLTNREFVENCFGSCQGLKVDDFHMGQSHQYKKQWKKSYQDKRKTYGNLGEEYVSEINAKAFYKGHFYAFLINEKHFDEIDEESFKAFSKIHKNRVGEKPNPSPINVRVLKALVGRGEKARE